MSTDICFLPATELAARIKRNELSPVTVVEAFLDRIERRNSRTNAFVTVFDQHARNEARTAEQALDSASALGALHGVPIAVKDLIPVSGFPTTYGSVPLEDFVPDTDAIAVSRLRDAGAIVIGKTNTSEFGHIATTDNELFGTTTNPYDTEKTSGGSSGGSAVAVADGLVPIALGTDAGGSIRIPASACGIYGFKPSFGRVARETRPNAFLTTHPFTEIGPLTRTVTDAALVLDIITGSHPRDMFCAPVLPDTHRTSRAGSLPDLTIGCTTDFGSRPVDPAVREGVSAAVSTLTDAGLSIESATPPLDELWTEMLDAARVIFQTRMTEFVETAQSMFSIDLREHQAELTPSFATMADRGRNYSARELHAANTTRTALFDAFQEYFAAYDLLIAPTLAVLPFDADLVGPDTIDDESTNPYTDWYLTLPFNMTGLPAASLPIGLSDSGLPIGLQLIGNRHDDPLVVTASEIIERVIDWNRHASP